MVRLYICAMGNSTGNAKLKKKGTDRVISLDGEVLDEKTIFYLAENDKQFYMTYSKVLSVITKYNLTGSDVKLLAWLAGNMDFNSNRITVTIGTKRIIAKEMDLSTGGISNSLGHLVDSGILYREKGSEKRRDCMYFINPEYYWKGDLSARNRVLKLVLSQQLLDMKIKK